MLSPSQMYALQNAINNNKLLKYAKDNFREEEFYRIYKSYRRAFWSQISLPILGVIFVVGAIIFIPAENVFNGVASTQETIIMFLLAGFTLIFPIWLIICNFTFGSEWRHYVKWYKSNVGSLDE